MGGDTGYWRGVISQGLAVPTDRPLGDLTADLTALLGSPDPELRDGIARSVLGTWIGRGVYDDLLAGLGDGMVAGLRNGLHSTGDDTVFRRSYSALVLADCIERESQVRRLGAGAVLRWGDHLAAWLVRERDVRGWVDGKGWAHAVAHGADAVAALARSPHLAATELTVLLDVLADRAVAPTDQPLVSGEPDRLAAATLAVLRRDLVPWSVVEPWVARLGQAAMTGAGDGDPYRPSATAQAMLRSLYLQLALGPRPPAARADLMLLLVDALRATNPFHLTDAAVL